jgi:hypothetical protein
VVTTLLSATVGGITGSIGTQGGALNDMLQYLRMSSTKRIIVYTINRVVEIKSNILK